MEDERPGRAMGACAAGGSEQELLFLLLFGQACEDLCKHSFYAL